MCFLSFYEGFKILDFPPCSHQLGSNFQCIFKKPELCLYLKINVSFLRKNCQFHRFDKRFKDFLRQDKKRAVFRAEESIKDFRTPIQYKTLTYAH